MTEKEKMLNEEIYNPNYDEELIKERTFAQELIMKKEMKDLNTLNQ